MCLTVLTKVQKHGSPLKVIRVSVNDRQYYEQNDTGQNGDFEGVKGDSETN